MNDFKDQNACLNMGEEFNALKDELNIDIEKELENQIDSKIDYLFVNHEWKDFIKSENPQIQTISCTKKF